MKSLPTSPNIAQRGFSLVEILLVLGLMSVIAVGAFLIYPRAQMSMQVNAAVEKSSLISTAAKNFFGTKRPPANLDNATAIAAGIVSAEDLTSPWGPIIFEDSPSGNAGVKITFQNLEPDVCKKLMSAMEPRYHAIALNGVFVKSKIVTYDALLAPAQCDGTAVNAIQVFPDM